MEYHKMKTVETNCETGEVIVRNATKEEVAHNKAIIKQIADERAQEEAKATARQAILDRLGLTADEAALILG